MTMVKTISIQIVAMITTEYLSHPVFGCSCMVDVTELVVVGCIFGILVISCIFGVLVISSIVGSLAGFSGRVFVFLVYLQPDPNNPNNMMMVIKFFIIIPFDGFCVI